jgi:SAM-dependent methyltransferase
MKDALGSLYEHRSLTDGYPNLQQIGSEYFAARMCTGSSDVDEIISCIDSIVSPGAASRRIAVVGCGQDPLALKHLLERGCDAVGVDPISEFVALAQEALGSSQRVLQGSAENLPLASASQDIVWLENVLEHVDSVGKSLAEAYRVLVPGGILYIKTSNRLRFSLVGRNHEYRVPFYNWFPALLKECYVFSHLHYKPHLANYTTRPAVHWFTYAKLCSFGREAGFAQFYSLPDVLSSGSRRVRLGLVRRGLFWLARRNLWIKALALTQVGGTVFMWKRPI